MVGLTGVMERSAGGTGGVGWRAAISAGRARPWSVVSSSKLGKMALERRVAAVLSECEPQLRVAYGARVRTRSKLRTFNGRREHREARKDEVETLAVSQGAGSTRRRAERCYEPTSKWVGVLPAASGRRKVTATSCEGAAVLSTKRLSAERRL